MALGQDKISILLVQQTIGVYSTSSLGALIAKAKTGGTGSVLINQYYDEYNNLVNVYAPMAFYVYETRGANGNRYDGVLIPGAEPHWNMWSRYMPAEWWVNNSGVLELRLKRNALNQKGGYDFRLHDFRGYDHSASKPHVAVPSTVNAISQSFTLDFLINMYQMALPHDITHIKVVGQVGIQTNSVLIPVEDINYTASLISAYSMSFSAVTESSGTVTVYGSNDIGQEVATMGAVFSVQNFSINYVSNFAYLSRQVAIPETLDYSILGSIIVPSGSGNIPIPAGGTQLTGITIRFTGISSIYSVVYFDLVLQQEDESNLYIGSYYALLSSSGEITDIYPDAITYKDTIAAGDSLGFLITNITV